MNKKIYGALLLLWWTYTLPKPPESYHPPRVTYQPAALLTIRDALRNFRLARENPGTQSLNLNIEFFNLQLERSEGQHEPPPINLDPLYKERLDR